MANKKVALDPSKWILDDNNFIRFRYRVQTDDYNISSAYSPTYSVEVPTALEVFDSVSSAVTYESVGDNTVMRLLWNTAPQYDDMKFYVFVKTTGSFSYNKTVSESSFSYIIPTVSLAASYTFAVTMQNTSKTVTAGSKLFEKTITF